ncbi:uncharacterized protein N7511_003446 [Penicillium nucicola]|uniref:uncharacterized protein n=1 Tax=Penicillium nucicola TaxID=1850975 RepID=UPI002545290A|nr:uncharacterized protein N7511_003446 [Penicillium nucicola]KAJ5771395.1 hypothetical protein N7511_003446 [Penicillium nucicola]
MSGAPSNKKCERCKKECLKCDQARPKCHRCINVGVECPGYNRPRKFIDQGVMLRRRYAPYQGSMPISAKASKSVNRADATDPAGAFSAWRLSTDQRTTSANPTQTIHADSGNVTNASPMEVNHTGWEDGSKLGQGSNETGSGQDLSHVFSLLQNLPGCELNGSSALSNEENDSVIATNYSPDSLNFSAGESCTIGSSKNLKETGPPSPSTLHSLGSLSYRKEQGNHSSMVSKPIYGGEHETTYLIRRYSDSIGPWLDLSDSYRFFSVHVPIRAIDNPALKHAMAAITAKYAGRTKSPNSEMQGERSETPRTESIGTDAHQIDWLLKGTNYYHMALSEISRITSRSLPFAGVSTGIFLIEAVNRWMRSNLTQNLRNGTTESLHDVGFVRKIEELLATLVLLTAYELMDTNANEWSQHLLGIGPLFENISQSGHMTEIMFSHGIRAAFWNFARFDFLGSYFPRSSTQLDPENQSLWRSAGITINDEGQFQIGPLREGGLIKEDQAANGILWLIFKIMNLLARVKRAQLAKVVGPSTLDLPIPQDNPPADQTIDPDSSTWLQLCFDLQSWFETLPETFRPSVRTYSSKDISQPKSTPFPEIVYGLPTCAAAILHYHFGRIALLLNQPTDNINAGSISFDRLHGYREITKEVDYHSREICGIAVGSPHSAVRLSLIPVLFAVGNCLEGVWERQIIFNLFREVESDLGWATHYAILRLQQMWSR